jgi:PIN domain nuclease of toxin-antitoxin system
MERRKSSIVFLDTHVIVWLYDALVNRFSTQAQSMMETSDLQMSPICMLELQYLYEIKRINIKPKTICHHLEVTIDLKKDEANFSNITDEAMSLSWTRDPFDRMIVAHAQYTKAHLITADQMIHAHYALAII